MTLVKHRWLLVMVMTVLAFVKLGRANELSFSAGGLTNDTGETTYSWQIDFRQNFLKHYARSLAWLNEGHILNHHRDDAVAQFWLRQNFFHNKLGLALGGGVARYYCTEPATSELDGDSIDKHGYGPIYSFSANYYTNSPLFFKLTFNRIIPNNDFNTSSLVLGVGYKLWKTKEDQGNGIPTADDNVGEKTTNNEFTAFIGKTVVNTFNSESDSARGLEYRKGLKKNWDWTLSYINEGDPEVTRRNGLGTQIWLVDDFLNQKLRVGFGVGVYVFLDRKNVPKEGDPSGDLAGLLGPTISYRFTDHWLTRFNWNRVVSDYNKDADVFLLGLGYAW